MNRLTGTARRQVLAVTATSFLTDISSEMIFQILPLFLANVLGIPTGLIGLIEGMAETTASILKGYSGWLSDKLGQRKWLTVAGYALSAFSKPFLFFVTGWLGVLVVRVVDRIGKGIRTSPRDALIADSVDEKTRGIAFGLHRAGDTAGAMLGIITALIIVLTTQHQENTLEGITFEHIVLISTIPAILAVIVLSVFALDIRPKKVQDKAKAVRRNFGSLDPRFRYFLLIVGVFTLGNSSDAFLTLRAQDRGLDVAGILGVLITFNLIYALVSGPAGALSDRIGRRKLIIAGWLAYGVVYLGFAAATTAWHIWILYGLYGLYYGTVEGSAKALIADLVPTEQRGTAYGFYNAAVGLVALPASVLAGILWQGIGGWRGFGAAAPFLAGSLLALTAVIMFVTWKPASAPAASSIAEVEGAK